MQWNHDILYVFQTRDGRSRPFHGVSAALQYCNCIRSIFAYICSNPSHSIPFPKILCLWGVNGNAGCPQSAASLYLTSEGRCQCLRVDPTWSAMEPSVHHSSAEVKIWSTMDPKLWQTVLEPSQRSSVLSIEASYVQGIMFNHFNHVQSDSNWNLLETGLRQGSFINLPLTCKPSSLIPAAWKWETSMSFAAALMLSCCSLGYQRYNQECPKRQSATNDQVIQVSSSTSDQPVINQWSTWKRILKVSTTMEQQPVWHLAAPQSKSSSLHQSPSQQCDICRTSADWRSENRCGLAMLKKRCCVRCFMILRRTVDPTSGQYIVLDCSSGCSENSTAYLVPWIHHDSPCCDMLRPSSSPKFWQLDPLGSTRRVPSGLRLWAVTPPATRRKLRWLVATLPQRRWSRRGLEDAWILPPWPSDLWLLLTSADFCQICPNWRSLQTGKSALMLQGLLRAITTQFASMLGKSKQNSGNTTCQEPCRERFLESVWAFVCWHGGSD